MKGVETLLSQFKIVYFVYGDIHVRVCFDIIVCFVYMCLFCAGGTPYPSIRTKDLASQLTDGYRMSKPQNCDEKM